MMDQSFHDCLRQHEPHVLVDDGDDDDAVIRRQMSICRRFILYINNEQ